VSDGLPDPAAQLREAGYEDASFAETYERYRPRAPEALLDLLALLAGGRPRLVVDLGSGTGLSTRAWAERADEVVGVEPSDAMRAVAAAATTAKNVRYVAGSSHATGLEKRSADVVTCSQSLQWMEPEPTFAEIGRILRPGGVFCAYEYRDLVTARWDAEEALEATMTAAGRIREARGLIPSATRFPPSVERLEESGIFERVRELTLHGVEPGDGERLVGFALALGTVRTVLADGVAEDEVGLDRLRSVAERLPPGPWLLGYRAWVGIRRG
jgi:SAM-dependent methyltransferase